MSSRIITRWEPEHPTFWQQEGKAVARRNLWISIPALTLAFIIWQVWIAIEHEMTIKRSFSKCFR